MKIINFKELKNKQKVETIPLILNSFIKNQLTKNELLKFFDKKQIANMLHNICRSLINSKQIFLAVENDSEILSYLICDLSCSEIPNNSGRIYFVYTKLPFRKLGIASDLINHAFKSNLDNVEYVMHNQSANYFFSKLNKNIKFNCAEFFKIIANGENKK